jgi:chemotaxis protein MotB
MRKKKHPEHVNHERWLISYADFITLLFAFFVVMFAVSQVDSKKVGRFTEAFSKAVGIDVFPMNGESLLSGGRTPDETSAGPSDRGATSVLEELHATLRKMAENNDALQGLQVIKMRHELVLRLPEGVIFDSGDAKVKEATGRMLKILTPELTKRSLEVRVEGHTDNRPIATGRYRSNWDLSTARASAVMVILLAEGMAPTRLAIAGYGEYRPIADNAAEDGRKQNRRVDLVVTAIASETELTKETGGSGREGAAAKESASTKETPGERASAKEGDGKEMAAVKEQAAEKEPSVEKEPANDPAPGSAAADPPQAKAETTP